MSSISFVSVAKGVFTFKNDNKSASRRSKNVYSDTMWYQSFMKLWNKIEIEIQNLNGEMFSDVTDKIVEFVKTSHESRVAEIPTAALLTGINMPDHVAQFQTLLDQIRKRASPHVVILKTEDCSDLKCLVETMLKQLMCEKENTKELPVKINKSNCNFLLLRSWYDSLYNLENLTIASPKKKKLKNKFNRNVLTVIIPDLESFNDNILHDFISIISSYIDVLPFVLIFGVATSLATLNRSIPYHVSSKINVRVFHFRSSIVYLNNVLENVLLNENCLFHLGGKVFDLFVDIFLFYDLSVSAFIQNFKYAMLEHFSFGNVMALCSDLKIDCVLDNFDHFDCENARRLQSFRKIVEGEKSAKIRIRLLSDDDYFKTTLEQEIKKVKRYVSNLHVYLKCLHVLVGDLPKSPLGKQIRELYSVVVSKSIVNTREYKQCFQLLALQSRNELYAKLNKIVDILSSSCQDGSFFISLQKFLIDLGNLDVDDIEIEIQQIDVISELQMDRKVLKEKLLKMSKQTKPFNKYEKLRSQIIDLLTKMFEISLSQPSDLNFYEIFFFDDISIRNHVIGSHRSAIHTALNDPHCYLQCACCTIASDDVILPEMPDLSIVYKLHLECGKMINLYDWLLAFSSIVDPQQIDDESKQIVVDPEIQARFTQAVAELEFLGFVKSSKRKTDHVARLTWGG